MERAKLVICILTLWSFVLCGIFCGEAKTPPTAKEGEIEIEKVALLDGCKLKVIKIDSCECITYLHTIIHKANCKNPIHNK